MVELHYQSLWDTFELQAKKEGWSKKERKQIAKELNLSNCKIDEFARLGICKKR